MQHLSEFIKNKVTIKAMVQKIGLSKPTIERYIKKTTGKTYREIKKQ